MFIHNYFHASCPPPKIVRRDVRRRDRGQRPTATKDPNTKQRRRRQSRHCSRVRWPRFPHLALRPHPSRHGSETASSHPVPCQKDVRRDVRRRDRGQRPTATEDPHTKPPRGGQAATVAGYAGPGFHTWPSGHIPQDNGSETASSHPVPCQKDVRRGVRRRDRGQRPQLQKKPWLLSHIL